MTIEDSFTVSELIRKNAVEKYIAVISVENSIAMNPSTSIPCNHFYPPTKFVKEDRRNRPRSDTHNNKVVRHLRLIAPDISQSVVNNLGRRPTALRALSHQLSR
ncbi:hypothetical protein AAHA92_32293 [Salvia divinorum]|uniref:Uncharacterized protein n=1 Tax=Salvia divinorum TaxID=28513 RepID=A0ABD1FK98_SALDI